MRATGSARFLSGVWVGATGVTVFLVAFVQHNYWLGLIVALLGALCAKAAWEAA
jgi:hypothetical protein